LHGHVVVDIGRLRQCIDWRQNTGRGSCHSQRH
jgi:hypothetical protein